MKRIPRPKGTTLSSINYNQSNQQLHYQQLVDSIITNYINEDYRLLGIPFSISELSEHFNIPLELLTKSFSERAKTMSGFMSQGDVIAAHERILGIAFQNLTKDRSLIAEQLSLLADSQGGTYKPFISGSVNDAIKMMMGSTKNFIDFIDKVMPKNSEMVNLIINGSKSESLSAHEAISLIRQEALNGRGNKALPTKETQMITNLSEVYSEHDLKAMPNVRANQADEAANINVTAKKLIEDPYAQIPKPKPLGDNEYGLSDYEEV